MSPLRLRALVTAAAAFSLAAAFGCGSNGNGSGGASNPPPTLINTVNDQNAPMGFAFASPVTVRSGTVVQWKNLSSAPHSIVWDNQTPNTSPAPGANIPNYGPAVGALSGTWTAPTVTTQTTYAYHCGIHGPTMNGEIIVTP